MSQAAAPSPRDGARPGTGPGAGRGVAPGAGPAAVAARERTDVAAGLLATTEPAPAALGTAELGTWVSRLAALAGAVDDAERIDQLRLLEEIKGACAAAQARVSVAFADSQLAAQAAAGVRPRDRGKGIAAQVALARRDSPHRGGRLLGLARTLVQEMPHTLDALTRGQTSEWRATILARETACLTRQDRAGVDADLGPRLKGMGDHDVETAGKAAAYRADPHAYLARSARAAADRTVTTRPAPDVMCRLTALLPVTAGVSSYAALKTHADTLKAGGDERTLGQIMADTLVERLTGQPAASPAPITLDLLLSADTLLTDGPEPAHLIGYGPIPAPLARDLARAEHPTAEVYLRRLFTDPATGALAAMESTARLFPENARRFLAYRDQTCRTPYCGAPIRHADHVRPHTDGGPTTTTNGQGLCAACNLTKQAPGWSARPDETGGAGTAVHTTTPTGHTYTSTPPPPPATRPPADRPDRPDRPDLYRHPRTRPNRRHGHHRDHPDRVHVILFDVPRTPAGG